MHLAIDLDDTVLDFVGGLRDSVKKEYGVVLTEEDIYQWDLHPILDPIIGQNWWTWLRDREWLWHTFPAVDGAIGTLDHLRREGHYLECVTSKPLWAEHNTWKWLGKWRPPFQRVTIVGPKDRKIDFTDAELLVDDKPQNCLEFLESDRKAILFARTHNLATDLSGLPRASSWAQVRQIIQGSVV